MAQLPRHAGIMSLASVGVFAAMAALEFVYFRRLSGGLPSLDLRIFGFTPDEGMAWLIALGRAGSEVIIVWHYLTFDLLFPALFSLTLVSIVMAAGQRLPGYSALPGKTQAMVGLALVLPYTLAAYGENIVLVRLLSDFLAANPESLRLASALVVTKFALAAVPVIVIGAFMLAAQRHHRQTNRQRGSNA